MEKIGLIAGNRKFPFLFCEAAKKKGYYIVAVAVEGEASPGLKKLADKTYWVGLAEFQRIFDIFKNEGITAAVMAGQISPRRLFGKEINKNEELKNLFAGIKDKKADTIFSAIAQRLRESGIELLDSTIFIKDYLPGRGVLTNRQPSAEVWEDIHFGRELAKAVAGMDIGQAVAVKAKAIVAVEALEGTDNLILRAAKITRQGGFTPLHPSSRGVTGFTIIKVSKPEQDMRFDIPVVGLVTVKNLIKAGASCLAIEADKTLFIDRKKAVALADRKGLCIVAV